MDTAMRARLVIAMLSAFSVILLSVWMPSAAGAPPAPPPELCERLEHTPAQVPMCSHGPDPVRAFGSPSEVAAPPPPASAAALAALCVDGGVSGKRIEVLYGVPQDRTNRYSTMLTTMRNVLAETNNNLDASDAATTQGYRWLCENGTDITIRNVTLVPVGADFSFDFNDYLNSLQNQVALGLGPVNYTGSNRVYMTFVDQVTDVYPYGGQGGIWNDDRSDPAVNANNDAGAKYSMTAYFDAGIVGHEIGHNIGAVQLSAPHTSGGWHCHDEWDLMCYSDGGSYFQNGGQLTFPCGTGSDFVMDCGRDDYYYPGTPPSTNYLSTHWNTANSGFLTPLSGGDITAPTVTARTPAANAPGVSVGSNVTATFSEPVQGVSGSTFTLRTSAGASVSASVSYNTTTRVATLDPTANLATSTTYTATLTGGSTAIRDIAGNPLVTTSWSFTTSGGDTTRPTVTARSPAVNATAVSQVANVTATFSEPVQGVGTASFTLRNAAGTSVAAAVSYNTTTRVATLNPSANLAPDTRYTATLTGSSTGIRDMAGNTLTTTSWTFLTGPRPVVTARSPAINATGVSRTANVTSTFSEAVQGVSGTTFTLRNPAGTVITAVVSYNATTRVATLNPSATLAAGTKYTARLTGGTTAIRDVAGNPLALTSWSFTTGA
jgi:hypothetical protein